MIQIFTDTSANLPAAYIQKYSLRVIPLHYSINGVQAEQDPTIDFDGKTYYDAMRNGAPVSTAMINLAAFLEPLHAALAAGDDVIYIGMSGGISGTAHAAAMAVQELQEEFPERKIAAIDTYAASLGETRTVIGADLTDDQIQTVYKTFGIERGSVKELTVTNQDERQYLSGVISDAQIGTKSISCISIEVLDAGKGMTVNTSHITYCTSQMYISALATAGITDAKITVTAPPS